jgi:DNA-binding beta-propeller fold protein YncE
MRRPRSALVPVAVVALAVVGSFGSRVTSCTGTVGTGPTFPLGAVVVPVSFTPLSVAGLPASCSGQTFYEASTSLCPPGLTYFLCDGHSYTEYDCAAPGSGWTLETLTEYDRVASSPSACTASGGSPSGTVYVEGNQRAPGENAVLVFRYCNGTFPSTLVGRYATGGSGSADLNDSGVLDADQQLAVNASGTLLFAVNQGSDSIAAFHIGGGGLLTPVSGSPFPSGGTAPASVGVSGNILVVANKAVDGLRDLATVAPSYVTFSIESDGSLHPTGSTFPLPLRSSPTQAFVAPGGRLVFATEESGVFRALTLSVTGDLALAKGSPLPLADSLFTDGIRPQPVWPAGLSASPTGSILYTGIPNNNSIAALDVAADGQLTLIGGERDPRASLPCWSVASADGRRVYFANAGSDNISVWDTETDSRHPHLLQTFLLPGGGNPWGVRIDSTGQLLFAITPRQVHQVPEAQGQLVHALPIAADGTLGEELDGSPVTLPVAPDTNPFGLAVVSDP